MAKETQTRSTLWGDEEYLATYGDGLGNVDLKKKVSYHRDHGRLCTVTAVHPPARFGVLEIEAGVVKHFGEKSQTGLGWINGGFFVLEPGIFKYLNGDLDNIQWEKGPLADIARDKQLAAFKHYDFWKCMDALRDRVELEDLWNSGNAKWKIW